MGSGAGVAGAPGNVGVGIGFVVERAGGGFRRASVLELVSRRYCQKISTGIIVWASRFSLANIVAAKVKLAGY